MHRRPELPINQARNQRLLYSILCGNCFKNAKIKLFAQTGLALFSNPVTIMVQALGPNILATEHFITNYVQVI